MSAKLQTIDEGSDSRNILEKTRGVQAASKRRIGRVFTPAPCNSAACVLAPSARTKGVGETLAQTRHARKSRICDMIGTAAAIARSSLN